MSHQPAAFMSYVRFDDQHENGRLSEFCRRLSGEVQLQTGEPFPIFQDQNDISWGQQWQQRIDESLDAVSSRAMIYAGTGEAPGTFRMTARRR